MSGIEFRSHTLRRSTDSFDPFLPQHTAVELICGASTIVIDAQTKKSAFVDLSELQKLITAPEQRLF